MSRESAGPSRGDPAAGRDWPVPRRPGAEDETYSLRVRSRHESAARTASAGSAEVTPSGEELCVLVMCAEFSSQLGPARVFRSLAAGLRVRPQGAAWLVCLPEGRHVGEFMRRSE